MTERFFAGWSVTGFLDKIHIKGSLQHSLLTLFSPTLLINMSQFFSTHYSGRGHIWVYIYTCIHIYLYYLYFLNLDSISMCVELFPSKKTTHHNDCKCYPEVKSIFIFNFHSVYQRWNNTLKLLMFFHKLYFIL